MGWFSDEKRTGANLILGSSGAASLTPYYTFRKNIFYASNYSSEITTFHLAKYKRDYRKDFNKNRLIPYGIDNNTLTINGSFISSVLSRTLSRLADEIGPLHSGSIPIGDTVVTSYPVLEGTVVERDTSYYTGLPSAIVGDYTTIKDIVAEQFANQHLNRQWSAYQSASDTSMTIYEAIDITDTSTQANRQVITNISLSQDLSSITYTRSSQYQATDPNDSTKFLTDSWLVFTTRTITCDVRRFTTHAIVATYQKTHADNLANYTVQTVKWIDDQVSQDALLPNLYPVAEELAYLQGENVLPSQITGTINIAEVREIDPVVSIKASNKALYDPDADTSNMTEAEQLKVRGFEKMCRSLGGSSSSYRDVMGNPAMDDVAIGSFINLNNCSKSTAMEKIAFRLLFCPEDNIAGRTSGRGMAIKASHKDGSDLESIIPLDTSRLELRAKVDQWEVQSIEEFNASYPIEEAVSFSDTTLWKVKVGTSFNEKTLAGSVIQSQYKAVIDSLNKDYKNNLSSSAYNTVHLEKFGDIDKYADPETVAVQTILDITAAAKQILIDADPDGEINNEVVHGSMVTLISYCDDYPNASDSKTIQDRVVIQVDSANPTDADIIAVVQKLGGKYKFFDVVHLKIKASDQSLDEYQYTSCMVENRAVGVGEYLTNDLAFSFLRRNRATGVINIVTLYKMEAKYFSTDLDWTFTQKWSDRENISFCIPVEYNSVSNGGFSYYEFLHLETLTNSTLMFVHKTVTIPWYATSKWIVVWQVIAVIVTVVVTYFSAGGATATVASVLTALIEALVIAYAIAEVVDFAVEKLGLNKNIGLLIKLIASIIAGDGNYVTIVLQVLDTGMRYYTAEVNDMIAKTAKSIEEVKKKQKELEKKILLESEFGKSKTIEEWAQRMKSENATRFGIDTSGSTVEIPDITELDRAELLARYDPEPMNLNVKPSVSNLFSSGRKIVDIEDAVARTEDFLKAFPRS